jgi:hypothetical protein
LTSFTQVSIFLAMPHPGILAGISGALGGLTCLLVFGTLVLGTLVLGKYRSDARQSHADLRKELLAGLSEQKVECSEQIALLKSSIAVLEPGARIDAGMATGGLTRSLRSQAVQLLRTGMPPEGAASILGIGRREMRLIACVSDRISVK